MVTTISARRSWASWASTAASPISSTSCDSEFVMTETREFAAVTQVVAAPTSGSVPFSSWLRSRRTWSIS